MVPFMSSLKLVDPVLLPPPHAASSAAENITSVDQAPDRLPGFLKLLASFQISVVSGGTPRASMVFAETPLRRFVHPRLPHRSRSLGATRDRPLEDGVP